MPLSKASPGLRKRHLSPDANDTKNLSPTSRPAGHKPFASGWYLPLAAVVSLAISASYLYGSHYTTSDLPSDYILCAPRGDQIYTVDETIPRTQCIVVQNEQFVGMGTLGGLAVCIFALSCTAEQSDRGCPETLGFHRNEFRNKQHPAKCTLDTFSTAWLYHRAWYLRCVFVELGLTLKNFFEKILSP